MPPPKSYKPRDGIDVHVRKHGEEWEAVIAFPNGRRFLINKDGKLREWFNDPDRRVKGWRPVKR